MNAQLDQLDNPQGNLVAIGDLTPSEQPLVSHEQWTSGNGKGLLLSVDTEPSDEFASADLIAIDFPSFSDGRGLSLAVLLRSRHGFVGVLRAVGDINADLLHYLARCGFNSFELNSPSVHPDGTNTVTGFNALAPYSDTYQASVMQPEPAYRRIRRGA